jgi:hypothetical protein
MLYIRAEPNSARTAVNQLMFMTSRFTGWARRCAALLPAALALLACAPASADSAIYKCVDDAGRVELTDVNKRGCKLLDVPGSIPAPAPRRGSAPARASAPVSTPTDFPKVDGSQQRVRDDDRREILNDELRSEEKKLAELQREFNGGEPERQGGERNNVKYQERVAALRDSIARALKNIDALKREIANVK